jgi:uncharacterized membrane protein YccC
MRGLGLGRLTRQGAHEANGGGIARRLISAIQLEVASVTVTGPVAQLAFRTALAGTIAILIAMAVDLDAPYWAGITAFGMIQHDMSATLSRSFDRVLGTILGAILGYVGACIPGRSAFFVLSMLMVSFTLYAQARVNHGYAVVLMGATFLLVMFGSLSAPDLALSLAVYRGLEIIVGVVAAGVVDILLVPDRLHGGGEAPKPGLFSGPIDEDQLVIALTGGIAVASVPAIWSGLELPGIGQTPITAIIIAIAFQRAPQWTAILRIIGCFIGGAYGLLWIPLAGESFILCLGSLFLGLYLSGHVLQRKGDASYAGHQAGVAVILAMVDGLGPPSSILPAIDRLVGIVGGVVLVSISQTLVAPVVRRCVLAAAQLTESTK